jgi:hypothetical protein
MAASFRQELNVMMSLWVQCVGAKYRPEIYDLSIGGRRFGVIG